MPDSTPNAERWIPVVSWEGYYEVSDRGRIRSLDRTVPYKGGTPRRLRGKVITRHLTSGYPSVVLSRNGLSSTEYVHALVLTAFVGPRPEGMECCHWDGNRLNAELGNLRWDTHSENQYDQVRHGTHKEHNQTHCSRNHPLVMPNLLKYRMVQGHRICRACACARNDQRFAELKGTPFDFQVASDARLAAIMEGRGPSKHRDRTRCPINHALIVPNIQFTRGTHRQCLACSRAHNDKYAAIRRGETTFDFRAAADRRYAAIMMDVAG